MTIKEAEDILGLDTNFFPYSDTYLKTLYKKLLKLHFPNGIVNITSIDFKRLKEAYDLLLSSKKIINYSDTRLKPDESKFSNEEETIISNYILGLDEKKLPDKLKNEIEAYYLVLCLLIPEDSFIKIVNELGGIDNVIECVDYQKYLANLFGVSLNKINLRLAEFYLFNAKDEEDLISKRKKIRMRKKENNLY